MSTDSQILADQTDDSVFVSHQSSVISASTGEDLTNVNGGNVSKSETRLSTEDFTTDQQDG